ncbi:3',5'-cyclic AMP phosphodiesterase CpdA [Cryobacterium mesophilum]|uniref:Phosphodiesterase n=1 Tax=Terrimesophilobacter mesophilus TaxID=433647 RepID=A0A4R8V8B4_9MICO|nr:metallophosphoesterase [Terrimesophilobacter mesophilus]MBB5634088.1 3',5'-cyclic AMP phosphodiesterase CpdA [Terrimesophilobacter mesophilus]TFB78675.1 phosphodiesterase [Terrimesophilobacter mesophilus]
MPPRTAEYSRPSHVILHLSDTHLLADGQPFDRVDGEARVRRVFDDLERSGLRPDAILFTGDLAERGEPVAYGKLRSIVDPVARRLGAQPIWVMGSHDDRAAFRTTMLGLSPSTDPIDRVHYLDGLRVITIDTSVPGHRFGRLEADQLDWLADELSTDAPHGTILAMHHPPIPCIVDLAVTVELREQGALAEVLKGTDVRSIVAGHLHYSTSGTFAGIPVSVASASCYTQDLAAAAGSVRLRDGAQAYNLIHVYDHTILHTVVPIGDSTTVDFVPAERVAQALELDGVVIPAAPSEDQWAFDSGDLDLVDESVTWELTWG